MFIVMMTALFVCKALHAIPHSNPLKSLMLRQSASDTCTRAANQSQTSSTLVQSLTILSDTTADQDNNKHSWCRRTVDFLMTCVLIRRFIVLHKRPSLNSWLYVPFPHSITDKTYLIVQHLNRTSIASNNNVFIRAYATMLQCVVYIIRRLSRSMCISHACAWCTYFSF